MNNKRLISFAATFLPLLLSTFVMNSRTFGEEGYGSITGQFVLDGKVPEQEVLVAKGDPKAKDAAICAAHPVLDDSLVIDKKSKGIQHIFIYERRASKIHPKLEKSKVAELEFDQKGCQFKPHTLLVRTDQKVIVKSGDGCAHNTHTYPIRGQAVNFLLKPNEREGIKIPNTTSEFLPTQIKCDIHPWMRAWWLVLDHPYAAVTDKSGKFTIKDLPVGEHEFRVWHERPGYIGMAKAKYTGGVGSKRGITVTIKSGETIDIGNIVVPLGTFDKD